MFKVISDIMKHCYDMWNTNVIALMENENDCVFIGNHYGIKCLSDLLQIEPCNVIPDIMKH